MTIKERYQKVLKVMLDIGQENHNQKMLLKNGLMLVEERNAQLKHERRCLSHRKV